MHSRSNLLPASPLSHQLIRVDVNAGRRSVRWPVLRYRKKGNGYVLYSIGPDLKDDSGERNGGKDIVFGVVNAK